MNSCTDQPSLLNLNGSIENEKQLFIQLVHVNRYSHELNPPRESQTIRKNNSIIQRKYYRKFIPIKVGTSVPIWNVGHKTQVSQYYQHKHDNLLTNDWLFSKKQVRNRLKTMVTTKTSQKRRIKTQSIEIVKKREITNRRSQISSYISKQQQNQNCIHVPIPVAVCEQKKQNKGQKSKKKATVTQFVRYFSWNDRSNKNIEIQKIKNTFNQAKY